MAQQHEYNLEKKNWIKNQREKPFSQIGISSGKPWPFGLYMRQYTYIKYHHFNLSRSTTRFRTQLYMMRLQWTASSKRQIPYSWGDKLIFLGGVSAASLSWIPWFPTFSLAQHAFGLQRVAAEPSCRFRAMQYSPAYRRTQDEAERRISKIPWFPTFSSAQHVTAEPSCRFRTMKMRPRISKDSGRSRTKNRALDSIYARNALLSILKYLKWLFDKRLESLEIPGRQGCAQLI